MTLEAKFGDDPLTLYLSMFPFDPPWKHQKTFGFLMFSGGQKGIFGRKRLNIQQNMFLEIFNILIRDSDCWFWHAIFRTDLPIFLTSYISGDCIIKVSMKMCTTKVSTRQCNSFFKDTRNGFFQCSSHQNK